VSSGNIVFLLDSAPATWTSQEDRHLRLCQALMCQNVRPVLVFAQPLRPDIHARLHGSGAEIETINYGKGPRHYQRELQALVRAFSITTAHIAFFDYFSALPWIARLSGIHHVIYEMQNSGEFSATSWKRRLLQLRTKAMTHPTTRVIAISEFVKQQLVRGGLAERKILVRYLGVDTERFRPDVRAREHWAHKYAIGGDELILSTVSYLRPFKNPQVLIGALKELATRNIQARLFVGGDGDMLPALKALTQQLGVADRVCWLGNVSEPQSLLQASDIFLLASVGEAFGLVLTEAMACGVPVVGSRSGALSEVVEDRRTGLLCPPLDAVAFADAIESLARDAPRRKHMGVQAMERVQRHFSVNIAVERTLRIYESLWKD